MVRVLVDGPAGSTCAATADDLVRFAGVFLADGKAANGTQVLARESVATMTEPLVDVPTEFAAERWCVGVSWRRTDTHVVLGHPGFNLSGCSLLSWVPELDAAVACVTNRPASYVVMVECVNQVLGRLGCVPPVLPQRTSATDVDPARHVGVYECGVARYEVSHDGGTLSLRVEGRGPLMSGFERSTTLVPAGPHGYLPEQPIQPGFDLPTAIAFVDYGGVPVLLNGGSGARKAGS